MAAQAEADRISRMEDEIKYMATKADIEGVRTEIAKLSATLTWRMIIVAGIAQAIGIGALIQFLPK